MTLIVQPGYGGAAVSDPDAQAYLQAVEVVDNQALEQSVQQAVNQFVIGCKADGIWTAIKASCILAGARTLAGALVPLVGTAPTPFAFLEVDYNRKTGLVGDGSTKYLNSNRNNNADPQDSVSHATWISSAPATSYIPIGAGFNLTGSTRCAPNPATPITTVRIRTATVMVIAGTSPAAAPNNNTLFGYRRSAFNASLARINSTNYTFTEASETPFAGNVFVFADNNAGSATGFMNGRLAFYSIGESLDLALLDARVTALVNAFAAIP